MAGEIGMFAAQTDSIVIDGNTIEATWYHFFVEGGGNVKLLAASSEDAQAMVRARFPGRAFAGGIARARPQSGDVYTCQVSAAQYGSDSNPKDIAEAARRGGVNYEVRTK